VGHIVYFAIVNTIVHNFQGFRWQPQSLLLLLLHLTLELALLALARTEPLLAAITSISLALATCLFGLRVILIKTGSGGRLTARLTRIYKVIGWPIVHTKTKPDNESTK